MNSPDDRDHVPVLTEIIEHAPRPAALVDGPALEALARQLERAVLERLGAEVDRIMTLAMDDVRTELAASITQMVREAVAASVAQALPVPSRVPKRD